jgi:DNA modification methylase
MTVTILKGDCREVLRGLPDESVHCVVTSPPYFGLRDYGVAGQIGLEPSPTEFVDEMVAVFRDVRRVLRDDGTLWLNLGDSYAASGRGGNPDESPHQKQSSNRGSRQFFQSEAVDAGVIGRKWVKPPTGYKQKDLIGVPWLVAFALRADGWYLRQDIIWSKPNPMPESVRDRCTKAHEYLFMLSKSRVYQYDAEAIKEPSTWDPANSKMPDGWDTAPGGHGSFHRNGREKGKRSDKQRGHSRRHAGFNEQWNDMEREQQCSGLRNKRSKRSVWEIAPAPFPDAHFATFPPALVEPCILAGCQKGGTVLDPFGGAGTTGLVADRLGRNAILIELNPEYAAMAERRIHNDAPLFADVQSGG